MSRANGRAGKPVLPLDSNIQIAFSSDALRVREAGWWPAVPAFTFAMLTPMEIRRALRSREILGD